MIELQGKYNSAKIFTDNVESTAIGQIIELCNQEFTQGSSIRIMPDVHAGAGCTIGTTMTISDKIVANLVGVDISCGVSVVMLQEKNIDFALLDRAIRDNVPSGFSIRSKPHWFSGSINLDELACREHVDLNRAILSIGTLGSGNHFIEVNKDSQDNIYLVIHSGSRNLGKQVAEYYQDLACQELLDRSGQKAELVARLKAEKREKDIEKELKKIALPKISKELAYLQGHSFLDYIHDMKIIQKYAQTNRMAMIDVIVKAMDLTIIDTFTTVHNYIDTDTMILRKGAVSANAGEKLIIPMNMEDGSLICVGKGNPDWNNSAPHGAGRLMSRGDAKRKLSMTDFADGMEGIWTTSVSENTLDECKKAYKPMEEIMENIKDTVDILEIIRPLYAFKAGKE